MTYRRSIRSLTGPVDKIVADLGARIITPLTSLTALAARYNSDDEYRTLKNFRDALEIHAQSVGSVLVATDVDGKVVYGQVPDPCLPLEAPEMQEAGEALLALIASNAARMRDLGSAKTCIDPRRQEFLVLAMPRYEYYPADGAVVYHYGPYICSVYLMPEKDLVTGEGIGNE